MPEIIWVLFVSLAGLKGELVSVPFEKRNLGQIRGPLDLYAGKAEICV